jgi:hypothetical protein
MGHSIAAKYAARPAAHFVRPSSRARERRLGLATVVSFAPASRRVTELRGWRGSGIGLRIGQRSPAVTRSPATDGRLRPAVRMQWAGSGRPAANHRPSADPAPWHA